MADAVLSVEIGAKLEKLSSGLKDGITDISSFVSQGNKEISKIEARFASLGKTTKEISENIQASFGGMSLDAYFQQVNKGSLSIAEAKKQTEMYRAELAKLKAAEQSLRISITEKNKALSDSKLALNEGKVSEQQYKTEAQRLRAELAALRLEKARNKTQTDAASGSYREAQQRLTALGRAIRESGNGFDLTNPKVKAQVAEYSKLNAKLKEFDRAMGNHQRNVGNYSSALSGSIPYISDFTTKAGLMAAAVAAGSKSFNTNLKLDSVKFALKESSNNALAFKVNLDFLRETADRLGHDFMSTANSFKQWTGAAKYSNLTGDESKQVFESVANAAAKMKMSADDTNGTIRALSQMLSKGKVQAEELRGQLGERLPGAFALAAKAMGVTEKELNKMLEKGEVISDEFLPKFAKQLDISFGNDKTQRIESMQASVNRLSTEFDLLWDSDRAKAFFTIVTDGLADIVRQANGVINSRSFRELMIRLSGMPGSNIVADAVKNASNYSKLSDVQKGAFKFEKKTTEERVKQLNAQKELVSLRAKEYNSAPSKKNLDELIYANSVYAELNKVHGQLGGFDVKTKNTVSGNSDADAKNKAKARQKAIDEQIKESEKLKKILLDSADSVSARELSGIQKTLSAINQKYEAWKRSALDAVKVSDSASETIKQLEINRKHETIVAIDAMIKKSLVEQEKEAKKTAFKIADATKKIAVDNIGIDLVFSRKFDETASQRALRVLNSEYKKIAQQLERDLQSQVSLGVTNIDPANRQQALQEEYFQKSERIYQQEQRMRVDMVDKRNMFNTALEKTNVLLDENARKLQAGAISVDEFQKVQSSLLNQQESLNVLKGVYDQFTNGIAESFTNMLTGTESFASGMENVIKSMVSTLIAQMARLAAIKLFGAIFTGGSSLLVPGFATGGYTGNLPTNKPAGVVHGKEFVFDAQSTQRIGVENLKALQSGKTPNISDFTPRVAKNISNFTSSANGVGNRPVSVRVSVDGDIRNNKMLISTKRAERSYRKFGKG